MRVDNPMIPWCCYMAELLVMKADNESFSNLSTIKSPNGILWYLTMTKKCAIILIAINAHETIENIYVCSLCTDKSHGRNHCFKK